MGSSLRIVIFYGGDAATVPREHILHWLRTPQVGMILGKSVEARKVSDWPATSGHSVDARVSEATEWAHKAIALISPDSRGEHGAPNVLEEIGRWREKKGGDTLTILRHRDVPVHSNQAGLVYIGYTDPTAIVDECREQLLVFLKQDLPEKIVTPEPRKADIAHQRQLLASYRERLADYRRREAILGIRTPYDIIFEMRSCREAIKDIKALLHGWGVQVADHPDDSERGTAPDMVG